MAIEDNNTKIKEIVNILKTDGVDAGKSEADKIIADAKKEATEMISNAHKEHDRIIEHARQESDNLHNSAKANIRMAVSQGINQFKESIENELLKNTILENLKKAMNGDTIKDVIITIVKAYSDKGFNENDLNILLDEKEGDKIKSVVMKEINEKIKNPDGIKISDDKIKQGAKIIQNKGNLSIEVSPESIQEILLNYIRPEFRKMFFDGAKNK